MANAFIGCGLAAKFRAEYLTEDRVQYCYDINPQAQSDFEKKFNCIEFNPNNIPDDVDNVFICTTHKELFEFSRQALLQNKNVCVEKPGAIWSEELWLLNEMAIENNKVLHVGYSISNTLFEKHDWANLLHFKGYYSHGARDGYDKEWRMSNRLEGGGVDHDLLPHLVHLSLLIDDFEFYNGMNQNVYWQSSCPDFSQINLVCGKKISSCTVNVCDWKNTFEINAVFNNSKLVIKDLNSQSGKYTSINYTETGPGIKPKEEMRANEENFWNYDTKMFLEKVKNNHPTDLAKEIKVLEILEKMK
jgi:predicted dehydrogenase